MALIFEDSEKVTKKQIYIPQNAKKIFKAMGKIYKPYVDKNLDGSKIMKSLSSETQYNKKGDTSNKNGQKKHDSVSVEDAKVRLHRQEKLNPNSVEYQLYGGQLAHDILKKGIEGARGVKTVDAVKPPKPTVSKPNVSKDLKKERNKMKVSNPKIKLESKKINESYYEESPFYKYLEEYDEGYVLNKFSENQHGKQDWGVLINPSMYEKALDVYHQRGDMASIFVEGGTKALNKISECKENKARKIYIRENQLLKLNAVNKRTNLPRKTRNEGKKRANK